MNSVVFVRAAALAVFGCLICVQGLPDLTAQDSTAAASTASESGAAIDFAQTEYFVQTESGSTSAIQWRYTRFGWQDATKWYRSTSVVRPTAIEKVHPTLIAANIFLAAFGCLIWFSNEREVDRFIGKTGQ